MARKRTTTKKPAPTKESTLDRLVEVDDTHNMCVRCEHRARFLETGAQPRCECGDAIIGIRPLTQALHRIANPGPGKGKEMPCKIAADALAEFEKTPMRSSGSGGCYMYRPVRPLVLAAREGDERPALGPAMIAARMRRVGIAKCTPRLMQCKDVFIPWMEPGDDGE